MARPDTISAPPGHDPGLQAVGADVLPFTPHPPDGDFSDLGYTLVPAEEHGSFFSPNRLAHFPLGLAKGLGRAAFDVTRHYSESILGVGSIGPERRVYTVGHNERVTLVTKHDPETGIDPKDVVKEFLIPGLAEIDMGSGLEYHRAKAQCHPDRDIISFLTSGVNLTGKTLPIAEGLYHSLDITAAENLQIAREIAGDNPSRISSISMGTFIAMRMAIQNLRTGRQLNADLIELGSPAIGGRNVPENAKVHRQDATNKELIDQATNEFLKHMPGNIWDMVKTQPEKAAQCASVVMGYLLEPHKLPNRGAVIAGNLRSVQKGIDWEDMKEVATAYDIHVLGGELDPLMQRQLAQWIALREEAPNTTIRLLQGLGHAMTMNAPAAVEQFDYMEHQRTSLTLALVA